MQRSTDQYQATLRCLFFTVLSQIYYNAHLSPGASNKQQLPHTSSDRGTVPTSGAVYVEFICSPYGCVGFPWML